MIDFSDVYGDHVEHRNCDDYSWWDSELGFDDDETFDGENFMNICGLPSSGCDPYAYPDW
jgi:hypothetical protein